MNSSLVKSVPQGEFVEISALMSSWESEMRTLASQKQPIKFDMFPKLNIPPEIRTLLSRTGYHDHILENDRWQHFLVPISNETGLDRFGGASALNKVGEPTLAATGLFDSM